MDAQQNTGATQQITGATAVFVCWFLTQGGVHLLFEIVLGKYYNSTHLSDFILNKRFVFTLLFPVFTCRVQVNTNNNQSAWFYVHISNVSWKKVLFDQRILVRSHFSIH